MASGAATVGAWACSNDPVKVDVDQSQRGPNFLDDPAPTGSTNPALIDDACVTDASAAEQRTVAMYVMLDSSGSMDEPTGTGATKWQAVQRAIRSFLIETNDSDLQMGLQFFPLLKPQTQFVCKKQSDCGPDGGPCFLSTCLLGDSDGTDPNKPRNILLCASQADCPGSQSVNPCVEFGLCENSDPARPTACQLGFDCAAPLGKCEDFERTCTNATECRVPSYATPAVEIGTIAENLVAIDRALELQKPQGLTPTVPALQGAINHAREWAITHPEQTVVTVLATDGLPSECGPEVPGAPPPINTVLEIAADALTGEVPVRTFVVGVFPAGDAASNNNTNAIARAGGTNEAVLIDTDGEVEGQFLDALRTIRSGSLACQFQIPKSDAALDYFRVNLQFDNGTDRKQLSYVTSQAGCAANPNGWHYDVDARVLQPSAIQVCPAVCDQFQAASTGSISLQLGCATVLR